MDWMTIGIAFLTFISGGGIAAIVLLPQKRRSADLENEAKVSEQWKELFIQCREEKSRQSDLIDKLYDDLTVARNQNNTLTTNNAILKLWKCEKLECGNRKPPISADPFKKLEEEHQ
jgi:hypothetical protein